MFRSCRVGVALILALGPCMSTHAAMPIPRPPAVSARSYILMDFRSGKVIAEQRADERMEPASLTKLMTAYGVFKALREKRLKLTDPVTISEHAWRAEGSRTFVQVGTQVPADVLIKGMIVQSGNDATIALAERIGGTEPAFVELMNEYAKNLGMRGTRFENSAGLTDARHYSTARDLATLASAIISEFPEYYRFYSLREFTWNRITQHNRNGLLSHDPTVDGMKTGYTESAGYCLVASANRDGMRLVSVVLGSPNAKAREAAGAALLEHGYTFYETVTVKSKGATVLKPRVWMAAEEIIAVGPLQDIVLTVGRGEAATLKTSARVAEPLVAPLTPGKAVGELTIKGSNGEVLERRPLFPLQAVEVGGLWTRAVDTVMLWFE